MISDAVAIIVTQDIVIRGKWIDEARLGLSPESLARSYMPSPISAPTTSVAVMALLTLRAKARKLAFRRRPWTSCAVPRHATIAVFRAALFCIRPATGRAQHDYPLHHFALRAVRGRPSLRNHLKKSLASASRDDADCLFTLKEAKWFWRMR